MVFRAASQAHGLKVRQSGHLFDDDPRYEKGIAFCAADPRHNMLLRLAHGEQEIDV